jgi:bacterioferritin (cytochrome b1)
MQTKAQRFIHVAQKKLRAGDIKTAERLLVAAEQEMVDPFALELDSFLEEKENNPQEMLEDKMEDEGQKFDEQMLQDLEDTSPQENMEETLEEETGVDLEELKTEDPKEDLAGGGGILNVESKINRIAQDVEDKGHPILAQKLKIASEHGVVDILNSLLKEEYLQRDLYETYDWLLFGPSSVAIQEHLQEHLKDEMEHIRLLQRYIVHLGGLPTLERHAVPAIDPLTFENILEKNLELEKSAVKLYSNFASALDENEDLLGLKVDLENIISEETEHVHDLQQWLADYAAVEK